MFNSLKTQVRVILMAALAAVAFVASPAKAADPVPMEWGPIEVAYSFEGNSSVLTVTVTETSPFSAAELANGREYFVFISRQETDSEEVFQQIVVRNEPGTFSTRFKQVQAGWHYFVSAQVKDANNQYADTVSASMPDPGTGAEFTAAKDAAAGLKASTKKPKRGAKVKMTAPKPAITQLVIGSESYPATTSIHYQWMIGTKSVAGANKVSFKVPAKLKKKSTKGKVLKFRATYRLAGYAPVTKTVKVGKIR